MIPAIRTRIDEANNVNTDDGGERVTIPASELEALGDFRRREYTQRAREEHNSRIAKMVETSSRAEAEHEVKVERQYGLPQGQACHDIWDLIFGHVDDVEDVKNLRDTCVMFRELFERKYTTLRFIQVALKFANKFGRFEFLLKLRRICRASKAAVDKLLSGERMPWRIGLGNSFIVDMEDLHMVRTPMICFQPDKASASKALVECLQSLQPVPYHFPVKLTAMREIDNDDGTHLATALRTQFQSFLGVAGSSVRQFEYISANGCLETYNQLRSWVTLMPNLEVLLLHAIMEGPMDPVHPPFNLDPFPSCPKLKRYMHSHSSLPLRSPAPLMTQIFLANPWISEVLIVYNGDSDDDDDDMIPPEDISVVLNTLQILQLEIFKLYCSDLVLPPLDILELRFQWPLKSLYLMISGEYQDFVETPSMTLFAFINSFSATLEELAVECEVRDNGGFLDLPKVSKLHWELWPNFMTLDFIVALESLQYLDVYVEHCPEINGSLESVQRFFEESNFSLPFIFPSLRRIRVSVENELLLVWKA